MKPVGLMDQSFLILERRNQPMHVGGLWILRPPDGMSSSDFAQDFAQRALEHRDAYPPFNQVLVRRAGLWFWKTDEEFDIESHFHHMALPAPGRIRELLALVSKLHGTLMDRTKPLWEMVIIDGIEDNRVAIYCRIHHALVDGVAGMRMLLRQLSEDPEERGIIPLWAMEPKKRDGRKQPPGALEVVTEAAGLVRQQAATLPTVARELFKSVRERRSDPDYVSVFQAPRSLLNQRISGARRFAAQSYSLPRIKAVSKALGVTINDVILAMCATALRTYLSELGELPDEPLVSMVPVSTRSDDSESGNQVAMILANLATHLADPGERLSTISRSIKNSKQRYSRMSQAEIMNYLASVMAVHGANMALGIRPEWQAFNIVVSNVPGPRVPMYYNGARVEGIYPVSIVLDGVALNITLHSYCDNIEIGLIACRRTLPHMQRLLGYLEQGLVELEAVAGKP